MSNSLKIGVIGLDTSHVPAFAKLLNDDTHEFHVPGGRIVAAFPGGSPDFPLSWNRVAGYTTELRDNFGVDILDSPATVAKTCDAILLTSVDGRVHLDQFREIAPLGKPVFIDKPFAVTSEDAEKMAALAEQYSVPLMSCSSLRFAQPLVEALSKDEAILGADCYGPMNFESTQPGFFWYGIHSVEIAFAILGSGYRSVHVASNADYDVISGEWDDGRIATIRGNRKGNNLFGALLHGETSSRHVEASVHPKPAYAGLLENVMTLFKSGVAPVPLETTLEIVRFIETANRVRQESIG